ncbi:Uncharacterised protein [Vibrio cholerae]|nr:Uncharacterised protein [Vibrio cholerae]
MFLTQIQLTQSAMCFGIIAIPTQRFLQQGNQGMAIADIELRQ